MPTATVSSQNFGNSCIANHSDVEQVEKEKLFHNEQSESDEDSVTEKSESASEQIYKKVLEESPFIVGDESPLTPVDHVSWLDMNKIKIAMEWFQEYIGIYAATTVLVMLSLAVAVKPISTLIFCNNKPMKRDEYFRRFLGKLRGTEKFFNVFMESGEIRKVFYKTRKLHTMAVSRLNKLAQGKPLPEVIVWQEKQWMRDVAQAVRKDVATIPVNPDHSPLPLHIKENLSWDTKLPFNQFGMVYFTAAFFGSAWQRPHLFGMKDKNDPKMLALIHMWAVIAKLLGLQDEFNIYINPDPKLIDRIANDVYIHSLANIDTCVINLEEMVATGIAAHIPFITQKMALCFALHALECENPENFWKVMSFKDKALFKFVQGVFWCAGNIEWFRHLSNWLFKKFIYRLYRVVLDKPAEKYQQQ